MERARPYVYAATLLAVVAAVIGGVHQLFQTLILYFVQWLVNSADSFGLALTHARIRAGNTGLPMFVAAALFLALAFGCFWLLRRSPGRRYMTRMALLLPAIVLMLGLDTLGYGAGVAFPAFLLSLLLATLLLVAVRNSVVGHALLTHGTMVGLAYLTTSGIAVAVGANGVGHLALQAGHSQVGLLWTPFLFAWTWSHIVRTDGVREDRVRWSGFLALAILALVSLTGLATLCMFADSPLAESAVHGTVAVVACGIGIWHALLRPSTSRPSWMAPLVLTGAVAGALLGLRATLMVTPGEGADPTISLTRLSHPSPALDSQPLDPRWLGSEKATIGCAGILACHTSERERWGKSAHGHSAGAIYSAVAARLVQEEGPAAAGLCAGCHDPMPLITGALVDGAPYPQAESAGVACGICHGIVEAPPPIGNGVYAVRGDPEFAITGAWRSTTYLLVKSHLPKHRRDWKPGILGSGEQCGTCHELVLRDLQLVGTFREWEGFAATGEEQPHCVDCHMPRLKGEGEPGHEPRDHRFLSGNISLPGLSQEERDERLRFMADAIALDIVDVTVREPARLLLTLRLTNVRDGHGFPTQPLDLAVYAFEARVDGGPWTALNKESLFKKTLLDADEKPLLGHELWKVAAVRGGQRILPGESRTWTYALPAEGGAVVEVRLVHQRLRDEFITPAMRAEGLMLDRVVVRTASAAIPRAS